MISFVEIEKDNYVTNRSTQNEGEKANLGRASTIDIFKLYNENKLGKYDCLLEIIDQGVDVSLFENLTIEIENIATQQITLKFLAIDEESFVFGSNQSQVSDDIIIPVNTSGTALTLDGILLNLARCLNGINTVTQNGPSGNISTNLSSYYDVANKTIIIKNEEKVYFKNRPTLSINYVDSTELFNVSGFNCVELSYGLLSLNLPNVTAINKDFITSANLVLKSVNLGNTSPETFNISCFELLKDFEEGYGKDVNNLSDYDISNFTSLSNSENLEIAGYFIEDIERNSINKTVSLNSLNDLRFDLESLVKSKYDSGTEKLRLLVGPSDATRKDQYTYFISRFGSRHVSNKILRPTLELHFNNQTENTKKFYFDMENDIVLDQKGISSFVKQDSFGNDYVDLFLRLYIKRYNNVTKAYDDIELTNPDTTIDPNNTLNGKRLEKNYNIYGIEKPGSFKTSINISRFDSTISSDVQNNSIKIYFEFFGVDSSGTKLILSEKENTFYVLEESKSLNFLTPFFNLSNNKDVFAEDQIEKFELSLLDRNLLYTETRRLLNITSSYVGDIYYHLFDLDTQKYIIHGEESSNKLTFNGEKYLFDFMVSKIFKNRPLEFIFKCRNSSTGLDNIIKSESFKVRFK